MADEQQKKPSYIQLLAAWLKKTKNGDDFISIAIGDNVKVIIDGEELEKGDWIQIWKNKRKFSDRHPDFLLLKKQDGNYDTKYTKKVSMPLRGEDVSALASEVEEALR